MNKTISPIAKIGLALLILAGLWSPQPAMAATGNIDTTNKYAWSENTGWHNFDPTNGGVTVYGTYLSGYVWAENTGYIKLGNNSGGPYTNTTSSNWGVNRDSSGNLSGYAWSENAGWINFNPSHSQVTISTANGSFDGYAWAENVGWIHFKNTSPAYNVVTTYTGGSPSATPTGGSPSATPTVDSGVASISDSIASIDDLALAYGSVTTGSSSDKKIIVTNSGDENLVLTDLAQTNPLADPFSITADNCSNKTLPAGGSCALYLRFSPTAAGAFSDSFDLDGNTVNVSGTGTESDVPDITVTDSIRPDDFLKKYDRDLPFGTVAVGSSSDSVVTVTNEGSTFLDIGIIGLDNPLSEPFSIIKNNCTEQSLSAAQSCMFAVRFSPTEAGTFSDSFEIPSNEPDESSVTLSVSGTGTTDTAPDLSVLPSEISFNVSVESSSPAQTVTIENIGTGDLTISAISITGADTSEFTIENDNCSGQTIASSGECTVEALFSPTSDGEKSASLTISSDDPDAPSTKVYLIGNPLITDGTAESSDATISDYTVADSMAGSPSNFTPLKSIGFSASDVEDGVDITFTFPSLPGTPVIYKKAGGGWKQIYPDNNCSGISSMSLNTSDNTLKFYIQDNSECDGDSATGAIQDPVILGEETGGDGGGGDFFIAIAAFLLLVGRFCRKAASCRNRK